MEDDVDIALFVGPSLWRGQWRLEETEVGDALVAPNQKLAVEDVTRHHQDLITNAVLCRNVVPHDLDAVHDRWRALVDLPSKIHGRNGILPDANALHHRAH